MSQKIKQKLKNWDADPFLADMGAIVFMALGLLFAEQMIIGLFFDIDVSLFDLGAITYCLGFSNACIIMLVLSILTERRKRIRIHIHQKEVITIKHAGDNTTYIIHDERDERDGGGMAEQDEEELRQMIYYNSKNLFRHCK
jgi:hypothetical protein